MDSEGDYKLTFVYHLLAVYDKLAQPLQQELKPYGITAKNFFVMLYIDLHPGASQREMAQVIHKDKTQVRQYIDKLEKKELCQRRRGPDRRTNAIYLTPRGQEIIDRYSDTVEKRISQMMRDIEPEDRQFFMKLMARIAAYEVKSEEGKKEYE